MHALLFPLLLAANPTVDQIHLRGEIALSEKEVRSVLQATRPRWVIPLIWKHRPEITDQAVQFDRGMLTEHYARQGYFAAKIEPRVYGREIEFKIEAGPYRQMEKDWDKELCTCLLRERDRARAEGRLDFDGFASVSGSKAVPRFEVGLMYRVGRIDFFGNKVFNDATLRRAMTFDEGDPLDLTKLNQSVDRLEAFGELDVRIDRDEEDWTGDIAVTLKEPKRGSWNLSGPAGPPSLFGPLTASIGTRLPIFSTWHIAASMPFFTLSLARPLLPGQEWLSGVVLSPQASWQGMLMGYGLNQLRARIAPKPQRWDPLVVPISAPEGTSAILCQAPGPKWRWLRMAAGMAIEWGLPIALF